MHTCVVLCMRLPHALLLSAEGHVQAVGSSSGSVGNMIRTDAIAKIKVKLSNSCNSNYMADAGFQSKNIGAFVDELLRKHADTTVRGGNFRHLGYQRFA